MYLGYMGLMLTLGAAEGLMASVVVYYIARLAGAPLSDTGRPLKRPLIFEKLIAKTPAALQENPKPKPNPSSNPKPTPTPNPDPDPSPSVRAVLGEQVRRRRHLRRRDLRRRGVSSARWTLRPAARCRACRCAF